LNWGLVFFSCALALQNENHKKENKNIPLTKTTSYFVSLKTDADTQWIKESLLQPLNQNSTAMIQTLV